MLQNPQWKPGIIYLFIYSFNLWVIYVIFTKEKLFKVTDLV